MIGVEVRSVRSRHGRTRPYFFSHLGETDRCQHKVTPVGGIGKRRLIQSANHILCKAVRGILLLDPQALKEERIHVSKNSYSYDGSMSFY